ncbi:NAD+ synthase [Rhodohalobacter sulfatireducens]|uniref:Glutamine-dependent NAD(+) synthetase n=1 Tax=Rhodohalobacter sulfatireducens TaxID=2911366 RepID=A0ABS9KE87_9BACT|nr:NAD+ synthase [Rhodohalobacter sulfatireducens]MCG2589173.1 NAD+ synthase [Rhodohalobacter sulfatireducens]
MKIRVEQLNPTVGALEANATLILESLEKAESAGIDLLILPEMVLIGYPAQDILENKAFQRSAYHYNEKIINATKNTALLFGSITKNEGVGRQMYNTALLAREGKVLGEAHKTLLPTYDVFDDLRYFEPNDRFKCLELDGNKIGVTICEDIWYNENEVQYHTYETDPAILLKEDGAQIIINISASPFTKTKHENRKEMLQNHAKKMNLPVLYSNQVGAQTEVLFDGDSMAINSGSEVIATMKTFEAGWFDVDWNLDKNNITAASDHQNDTYPEKGPARIFEALKMGVYDYVHKLGIADQVILGLSGGIDSALVCTIVAEALGAENVKALNMPSTFSSEGSVSDSEKLAENLGIELLDVPIQSIFDEFNQQLKPIFKGTEFGVAEENLQSRIRGVLLMACANKFGYFLMTTGNKSEYAVGYATLYGDMNGALVVIGDLYKTQVYEMARWLNDEYYEKEVIPEATITKPPSAELRPDQKDTDSLPEYDVLDDILYRYIELQEGAQFIIDDGYDEQTVKKVIRLVEANEFKRYQAAPILKVSSKAFGIGRRWPIVQKWTANNK